VLSAEAKFHPWLHRIALLTACATFPLIFMGGLVTSHQAGMSVPDWPNSYGYNMFLFPPRLWIGGILYEHTHRLMGTIVGMLSMALVATAWRTEIGFAFRWIWSTIIAALRPHLRWLSIPPSTPPIRLPSAVERHLRWLAFSVLAAVLFQGILGGLRVVLVKLDLAIVHACVAQAFFCLATLVAIITSKWWQSVQRSSFSVQRSLLILSITTFTLIYLQLIAGALMRHHEAGLAIPDIPFAYGHLLPPTTTTELDQINHLRAWQLDLPPVTLTQIAFHYAHRVGALLVTVACLSLIATIFLCHRTRALLLPAGILFVLLLTQLTLGIFTVLMRKPADIASFHVAVGALCLVTTFTIAVRAFRLYAHVGSAVRTIPQPGPHDGPYVALPTA
jgi:heme a synthase